MKHLITLAVLLTLSACGSVNMELVSASIDKCAPHGGLKRINTAPPNESAFCNDGSFVVTGKPAAAYVPGNGGL